MISRAIGAVLALAAQSAAQSGQPAKLIVVSGGSIAITDYSSMARCEAARVALKKVTERENAANPPQSLPTGGVIVTPPLFFRSLCIPA